MSVFKGQYKKTPDTDPGPSPIIWADCPWIDALGDPSVGYGFYDDFDAVPLTEGQTTELAWGKYKVFADTGGSVLPDPTFNSIETPGGILKFESDTDNDSASLASQAEPYRISGVETTDGKLFFECRVAVSSAVTNGIGFLVGLANVDALTLAQAVPLNAGDTLASMEFLGFQYPEDDTTTGDTGYTDAGGGAITKVGDGEITGIVANTWLKLGFTYDPTDAVNCIVFYQDGVKLATVISRATLVALSALDVGCLGLIFAHIVDSSGTAINSYMDWWRCFQLRV